MKDVYIGIPSLTEAQRAAELLRRERIGCAVVRMPAMSGIRCSYGLRLGESGMTAALAALRGRVHTGRIAVREADGTLREWNA